VVADVPPAILSGSLLPPRRGWFNRNEILDGPWRPLRVAQVMLAACPKAILPSELGGHCLIVRELRRPARDENMVFVRSLPSWEKGEGSKDIRCITVGRFVPPQSVDEDESASADLLEALEEIAPGAAEATAYREVLRPDVLGEIWGRPSGVARYGLVSPEWLGHRGFPHSVGWPGLLAVGDWTYPGRLVSSSVEGAMRVVDLITNGP
jgi:hypothetical protein